VTSGKLVYKQWVLLVSSDRDAMSNIIHDIQLACSSRDWTN